MDRTKLYRALLTAYPAEYRREFGEEMLLVYREVESEHGVQGSVARARLLLREILGLITGALVEHWRALGGPIPKIDFRRFDMRDEFRFPRSTVVFMMLVLAGIVVALEKGKHIYSPLGGVYPSLVMFMVAAIAIVGAVAALGWLLLRATHRTGSQRLEDLQL